MQIRLVSSFYHFNNLYIWIGLVDWQACSVGNGIIDVAYFITQSLTIDQRKEHENLLLDHYHKNLVKHLPVTENTISLEDINLYYNHALWYMVM